MIFLPLNILHPMVGCKVGCGGSLLLCYIGYTQQHKLLINTGNYNGQISKGQKYLFDELYFTEEIWYVLICSAQTW